MSFEEGTSTAQHSPFLKGGLVFQTYCWWDGHAIPSMGECAMLWRFGTEHGLSSRSNGLRIDLE